MSNPQHKNATDMIRFLIKQDVEIRTAQGKKICESFAQHDRDEAMSLVWADMLRRKGSFDPTCSEVQEINEYAKAGDPSARLALEEEAERQRLMLVLEAFEEKKAEEQGAEEAKGTTEAKDDVVEVVKFTYDGVNYLRDRNDIVYDRGDHFEVGRWDKTTKTVTLNWCKPADEM